jgi:hypothetical protein
VNVEAPVEADALGAVVEKQLSAHGKEAGQDLNP